MSSITERGYMGEVLRIDLTTGLVTKNALDEANLKKYIGGTGLGLMYLYNEVPPGVEWSDPENRLALMSGPLGGTIGGTGLYSVITKGAMTNGGASSQASGFWGAFIKSSGFDGLVVQGASKKWIYIYIHDGTAEIRDASYLLGKNTWETQEAIEKELGKSRRQLSVTSIGPAGENLVRFAYLMGDRGHVASHNGVGAVMGSKKLKAVAVERGKQKVTVKNREKLNQLHKELMEKMKAHPLKMWDGTQVTLITLGGLGILPIKNYSSPDWSEYENLDGTKARKYVSNQLISW